MLIIVKTALVTCVFYVGITVLLGALLLGVTLWKGGVAYSVNFTTFAFIFGVIWLASFALAWRVTVVPFLAKFPPELR